MHKHNAYKLITTVYVTHDTAACNSWGTVFIIKMSLVQLPAISVLCN